MAKIKIISLRKAKEKAVYAFQKWVRHRDAKGSINTCITCGRIKNVEGKGNIQAGHFIPGRHNATLFDERGCHPQCYTCNVLLGGNGPLYYQWMLKQYGQAVINDLIRLSNTTVKYTVQDYLNIEEKYLKKLALGEFN